MWSGPPAWTTDISTASGGITDHDGEMRRSVPESELFLISGLLCGPEPGNPVTGRRFGGLGLCLHELRLLYIIPWTQQGKDHMSTSTLSLTCHHYCISCSASLHSTCASLFFYLFHLCVILVPARMEVFIVTGMSLHWDKASGCRQCSATFRNKTTLQEKFERLIWSHEDVKTQRPRAVQV